ncbi:MAG TPA: MBL fold metallo-hydrolase, partial [Gemmatimonadaceae bacterium]
HGDHVLGLTALLAARQFPSLHSGGPLTVAYPEGCPAVAALRTTLTGLWPHATFNRIRWVPMTDGDRISLGPLRDLVAFRVEHATDQPCLGYAVVERRKRLTSAARALPAAELQSRLRRGEKAGLEEPYTHTLLAHTGDSLAQGHPLFWDADVLVHDCTFLDAGDRDEPTHAALPEVLEVATASRVRALVLHHVSQRYDRASLAVRIRASVTEPALERGVWLWDEAHITRLV